MQQIFAVILSITVIVCLLGCGVKSKEPARPNLNPVSGSGELPKNVHQTSLKKYLVFLTQTTFKVGVAKVNYRVLTPTLEVPGAVPGDNEVAFRIKYFMPEMPEMPVTPAQVKILAPGQLEVSYDISMEGAWEFRLEVVSKANEKNGTPQGLLLIDQFIHSDVVKE